MRTYDLAIAGSGFSGSLLAMIGRKLGLSVLLLEKGKHPRFAIGESSTPLAAITLERLAKRFNLPQLLPLTAYGLWQQKNPELVCGLKRGFTFFHHELGKRFNIPDDRTNQLLVAASPHDNIADTHWLRSDVDQFLVKEAIALGTEYSDQANLHSYEWNGETGTITGSRNGEEFSVRTKFLIDCSGENGFLVNQLHLQKTPFPNAPATRTVFNHFRGVKKWTEAGNPFPNDTPPYSIDNAAVHHVFDGGWIWILHFNNGITSAGIVLTESSPNKLSSTSESPWGRGTKGEGETIWNQVMNQLPSVKKLFQNAGPIMPWRFAGSLPRLCETITGNGWALAPHTAGFVDPMFSSGIALTILGVERLAGVLEFIADRKDPSAELHAYKTRTKNEIKTMAQFIGAIYKTFDCFPLFTPLSNLYFVAASYTETALHLDLPHKAAGFLLNENPEFKKIFDHFTRHPILDADHSSLSKNELNAFAGEIAEALAPWNIAGLCNPEKRNWYGFELDAVLDYGGFFGVRRKEMTTLITEQRKRIHNCGILTQA